MDIASMVDIVILSTSMRNVKRNIVMWKPALTVTPSSASICKFQEFCDFDHGEKENETEDISEAKALKT